MESNELLQVQSIDRSKAMWIHLSAIIPLCFVFIFGIFVGIVGIFLWQSVLSLGLKWYSKNAPPYIKTNIDAAYKFSLGIVGYATLIWLALILIGALSRGQVSPQKLLIFIIPILFFLYGFWFLMTIRAAVRAKRGVTPLYPNLPLVTKKTA